MSNIDKLPAQTPEHLDADALFGLLVKRADELAGCTEGSAEEGELEALTDAIEAYEAVRWPGGRIAGSKG